VLFQARNDDATRQAKPFRFRRGVADEQSPGTVPKRRERPFLQDFIGSGEGGMKVGKQRPKAGRSRALDSWQPYIHTGWYVKSA